MNNISKTDWDRIDSMEDEDINTSDIPPLGEDFLTKAHLKMPSTPLMISVEVDPETLAWFQNQGEKGKQQMSVALKIYAQAHQCYCRSVVE